MGLIVRGVRVHPTLGARPDPVDVLVEGDRIAAIRPPGVLPTPSGAEPSTSTARVGSCAGSSSRTSTSMPCSRKASPATTGAGPSSRASRSGASAWEASPART